MQVSRLIYKMKEESMGRAEGTTRTQLREKIAALPQSQLARAIDALAMIWNGMGKPLDSPTTGPKPTVASAIFPNWHRVKLALLKSISTGTLLDVQFYAYNAIYNDLPLNPRPLFTSSIVIEEWKTAIAPRK